MLPLHTEPDLTGALPSPSEVRDLLQDGAVPDAVPAAGNHAPAAVPAGVPRVRRGHGGGAGGTGEVRAGMCCSPVPSPAPHWEGQPGVKPALSQPSVELTPLGMTSTPPCALFFYSRKEIKKPETSVGLRSGRRCGRRGQKNVCLSPTDPYSGMLTTGTCCSSGWLCPAGAWRGVGPAQHHAISKVGKGFSKLSPIHSPTTNMSPSATSPAALG